MVEKLRNRKRRSVVMQISGKSPNNSPPELMWSWVLRQFGGLAKVDRVVFMPPVSPSFVP